MSRLFWMVLGGGIAVWAFVRGRDVLRRFTPAGVQKRVVSTSEDVAVGLGDLMGTYRAARDEREAQLRRELGMEIEYK